MTSPRTDAAGAQVKVAVLADDLTGAGDTAVQFAEAGWPAFLQRSPEPPSLPDLAMVARALNTRALPSDAADRRTAEAVAAQVAAGVTRLYLKIDSTMRGSVAAQLAGALRAWRVHHPGAFVVLCPAYPAMGRTIREGRLWVNGQPLETSPAGTDPVTPVTTSVMTELVPGAAVVATGAVESLRTEILAAAQRSAIVVVEAQSTEHVETLAEVVAGFGPAALPAGSAGLALPLAAAWHPRRSAARPAPARTVKGRILVVLTSANEVSRRQVRAAQAALGPRMQLAALGTDDVVDPGRAEEWAAALALDPTATVLGIAAPPERLTGPGQVEAGAQVATAVAAAACRLVERAQIEALVLLGGDGAEATLNRLGVDALRVLRRVTEGVPLSETIGASSAGIAVVTKAGGFGDERTIVTVLRALRGEGV